MIMRKIIHTYITALYAVAEKKNNIEGATEAIEALSGMIATHRDFAKIILSPVIAASIKGNIIKEIFAGKAPEYFINFIHIICKKNRSKLLLHLKDAWETLLRARSNIVSVAVTFARNPDSNDKQHITGYLKKIMPDTTFKITYSVDPSLIGGFKLMAKNKIYDNSIVGHVLYMKKMLC
jgi:F-type H+-transporting ATPase subunit delta